MLNHQTAFRLLLLLLLMGCGTTNPQPSVVTKQAIVKLTIPIDLLTCQNDPIAPTSQNDKDIALWISAVWASGEDCRTNLQQIAKLQSDE